MAICLGIDLFHTLNSQVSSDYFRANLKQYLYPLLGLHHTFYHVSIGRPD